MSRYYKKQCLDGIATLTNNPLALDNIRKQKSAGKGIYNDTGKRNNGE
ncbi:MAG: hypothetical protein NC344_05560 [Bacteroidales bacterium]|nr:hypothetical protein [Bacteroidales bacterium]MCM1147286.1 hypothetical protein [Bacteroidales bacterium]MCM1206280.1 hypothetical protein [Bacillota bacterium]